MSDKIRVIFSLSGLAFCLAVSILVFVSGIFPYPLVNGDMFGSIDRLAVYKGHAKPISAEISFIIDQKRIDSILKSIIFVPKEFQPLTRQSIELEMYKGTRQFAKIRISVDGKRADVVWENGFSSYLVNPGFQVPDDPKEHVVRVIKYNDRKELSKITSFLEQKGCFCAISSFNPFYYFIYDNEPVYETWGERKIKVFLKPEQQKYLLELERRGLATVVRRDIGRIARLRNYKDNVLEDLGEIH